MQTSWRVVSGALRRNAQAAFPEEAFSKDVVVQRFFGRKHILLQRPDAIRHVLIDNAQNYRRSPTAEPVLRQCSDEGCSSAPARIGAISGGRSRPPLRRARSMCWRGRL
jgi:hypothetical protein